MQSKVSVVVPCFNAEKYLSQALDSIFSQTFENIEVIAIDDGSTDRTLEILKSYGDRLIFRTGPNQGVSSARNIGTSLATGDYIQYIDSDDLIAENSIELKVKALEKSEADVAYSDWQKLKEQESGKFLLSRKISRKIEDIDSDCQIALFTDFWAPPAALLYTRRIVEKIGGWNISLPIIQDARFLLDASLSGGEFVHVPKVLAYYRVHRDSISLSNRSERDFNLDCYQNTLEIEKIWTERGELKFERKKALLKNYGRIARFFFEDDRLLFDKILNNLKSLDASYLPPFPLHLRLFSIFLGYKNAEFLALWYRRARNIIFSMQ